MIVLKYFIAFILVFAFSWLPLIGAYDYEASVCVAILGLICIPILAPKNPEKTGRFNLLKVFLTACLFWILGNIATIFVALLRNELCQFSNGLIYQLLIALPSNILAGLFWGWCTVLSSKKYVRVPVYVLFLLLDIGFALYALYEWPPLIAFGQFFGYFAGSIYDEAIDVFKSLTFYRIGSLLLVLCMAGAQIARPGWPRKLILPVVGIGIVFGYHVFLSRMEILPPMGRGSIQSALWQTVSDPQKRFTVHYQPKTKNRREIRYRNDRILRDYLADYQYLKNYFGNEPPEPIDIWIYPDAKVKGRFIGAERTSFARVWKNEIHLVEAAPDSTLARHEMAHLFAAEFGNRPLRLAGSKLIPTMGWIEGLAMAAEWPIQMYNLHTWSQAILDNPEQFGEISAHQILYGFWGLPSRVAYTLAGSYVRYMIDRFGMDKVKVLSNSMPGSFESILGTDFYTTFEDWKVLLNQHYSHPKAQILAPVIYGSSSIFDKHCARYKSKLDAEFYQCLNDSFCSVRNLDDLLEQDKSPVCLLKQCQVAENQSIPLKIPEKYYRLYMQSNPLEVDEIVPRPMVLMNQYLNDIFSLGLNDYAQKEIESRDRLIKPDVLELSSGQWRRLINATLSKVKDEEFSASSRLVWLERRADMLWHSRMYYTASTLYSLMNQMVLPESMARRIEIKRMASGHPENPVSGQILLWFTTNRPQDYLIIPEHYPEVQILSYLDFVASMNRGDYERARAAWIRIMLSVGETDPARRMPPRAWTELFRLVEFL